MKLVRYITLASALVFCAGEYLYSQTIDTIKQSVVTLESSTIAVKGITCKKDLGMIADNVGKLKGVHVFEVIKKGATSKFKVEFDPAMVTREEIHAAIEGTGSCEDPNLRPYKVKQ